MERRGPERRQCIPAHAVGVAFMPPGAKPPPVDLVIREASAFRERHFLAAKDMLRALGEPADKITRVEAELRIFGHDATHLHHDKGFRALAALPDPLLAKLALHVLRVSHTGALKIESLNGPDFDGDPANNRFLLIYHGHMRMLQPPADFKLADFFARLKAPRAELRCGGWGEFHDAALSQLAPDDVPADSYLHCQRCVQAHHERLEGLRASGDPAPADHRYPGARTGRGRGFALLSLLAQLVAPRLVAGYSQPPALLELGAGAGHLSAAFNATSGCSAETTWAINSNNASCSAWNSWTSPLVIDRRAARLRSISSRPSPPTPDGARADASVAHRSASTRADCAAGIAADRGCDADAPGPAPAAGPCNRVE